MRWIPFVLLAAAAACALRLRSYLDNDPGWVGHAPIVTGLIAAIAVLAAAALLSVPLVWPRRQPTGIGGGGASQGSAGAQAKANSRSQGLGVAMSWPRWTLLGLAAVTGAVALYLYHFQLTVTPLEGTTGLVVVVFFVFAAAALVSWGLGGCGGSCGGRGGGCGCSCMRCGAGSCACGHACCGDDAGGCDCDHCVGCAADNCCGECECCGPEGTDGAPGSQGDGHGDL